VFQLPRTIQALLDGRRPLEGQRAGRLAHVLLPPAADVLAVPRREPQGRRHHLAVLRHGDRGVARSGASAHLEVRAGLAVGHLFENVDVPAQVEDILQHLHEPVRIRLRPERPSVVPACDEITLPTVNRGTAAAGSTRTNHAGPNATFSR